MAFDVSYIYKLKDQISPQLRKIKSNFKDAANAVSRNSSKMSRDILRAEKSTNRLRGSFGALKKAAKAAGAATIATGTAFASFETGLVQTLNLLDRKEIDKFEGKLKALQKEGVKAGFTIQSTNKALFDTVSALGASESSFKTFQQAQKLAIAGNTDLSTAVDGLTSIVNAYGRESTDAFRVANAFFTAQKAGKTTVEELSNSIGRAAPIARSAGVSLEELLATVSTLTLGGLSTAEAVTGVRGVLNSLIKPSKEAEKVLTAMGVSFGAESIKAKGLKGVLEELTVATNKYGVDALARAIPEMEAFNAVAALNSDSLKQIDGIMQQVNKDVKNGTGLMEAYTRANETLSIAFKKTVGSVKSYLAATGEFIAPKLKRSLEISQSFLGGAESRTSEVVSKSQSKKDIGKVSDWTNVSESTMNGEIKVTFANAPEGMKSYTSMMRNDTNMKLGTNSIMTAAQ